MGKFSKYQRKSPPRREMNPIWRGIGCLLILIVPAVSYFLAQFLLRLAKQANLVPPELLGTIQFPTWVWGMPTLATIARFVGSLQDVWAFLIFFAATLFLLAGLISMIYSMIYQVIGPPRYSELDSPPPRKTPTYKR